MQGKRFGAIGANMDRRKYFINALILSLLLAVFILFIPSAIAACRTASCDEKAEKKDMELVGYSDLQGRNSYMPVIQKQGDRWIAYVGHHANRPQHRLNPLTNKEEPSGTSIVDVTDP